METGQQTKLFRMNAMLKMASPEQLDQLMQVTKPTAWLSLITIGVMLLIVIIWGFIGKLPFKVNGQGIIINEGGIVDIVSIGGGQLMEVIPQVGETVEAGRLVAIVAKPSMVQQLESSKQYLNEVKKEYDNTLKLLSANQRNSLMSNDQQKEQIQASIKIMREKVQFLEQKEKSIQVLLDQELVTEDRLFDIRQQLSQAKTELNKLRSQSQQIGTQKITIAAETEKNISLLRQKLADARRNVEQLELGLSMNSRVISQFTGKIIEITTYKGKMVSPGTPIMKLELGKDEVKALIFVPAIDGKQASTGMKVNVSPSTAKREKFGSIIGVVTNVAKYPSSPQNMVSILENQALAKMFSKEGPPLMISAQLQKDSNTVSGYKWTSSKGPDLEITSGTVCDASIVIREDMPISLVIPYLKEKLGL